MAATAFESVMWLTERTKGSWWSRTVGVYLTARHSSCFDIYKPRILEPLHENAISRVQGQSAVRGLLLSADNWSPASSTASVIHAQAVETDTRLSSGSAVSPSLSLAAAASATQTTAQHPGASIPRRSALAAPTSPSALPEPIRSKHSDPGETGDARCWNGKGGARYGSTPK